MAFRKADECAPRIRAKKELLDSIDSELNREIESQVKRSTSLEQRATILLGAASVVAALQVSVDPSVFTFVKLVLSFLAAAAGVIVVFPRTGDALNLRRIRDDLMTMPSREGQYKLIETKLEILEADEDWLTIRGRIAGAGFIVLAASILVSLLMALGVGGGTSPSPSPSTVPTPTSTQ